MTLFLKFIKLGNKSLIFKHYILNNVHTTQIMIQISKISFFILQNNSTLTKDTSSTCLLLVNNVNLRRSKVNDVIRSFFMSLDIGYSYFKINVVQIQIVF